MPIKNYHDLGVALVAAVLVVSTLINVFFSKKQRSLVQKVSIAALALVIGCLPLSLVIQYGSAHKETVKGCLAKETIFKSKNVPGGGRKNIFASIFPQQYEVTSCGTFTEADSAPVYFYTGYHYTLTYYHTIKLFGSENILAAIQIEDPD